MGDSALPQRLGRYLLFDAIGAGGMATVHLGRLDGPTGFNRAVAIKRLHQEYARDPEFVAMFLDEARLAARLRHPNVVPTLEVVIDGRTIGLVMEYVHGEPLSRLAKMVNARALRFPIRIAVGIGAGMLHGLHAAHEAKDERGQPLNIIHRDVSPQNVLVGIDGTTRVVDFGVAKASGRLQTTRDGKLKGKIAYMSPEQLLANPPHRRFDVYAAAVVLWEMLAGKRLFSGDLDAIVLASVMQEKVQRPSELNPEVPPALDEVVLRGLERDPERRFATAREMAMALEKALPAASTAEIGEWVEATAVDSLRQRAELVAAIEGASEAELASDAKSILSHVTGGDALVARSSPKLEASGDLTTGAASSVTHATVPSTARAKSPPVLWVAAALAGIVASIVVVAVLVGRSAQHSPPAAPTPAVAVAPPSVETIVLPSQSSAPSSATSIAPAPPSVTVRTAAPTTVKRAPASSTSTRADCDPPYLFDAEGHKVYKLNCL